MISAWKARRVFSALIWMLLASAGMAQEKGGEPPRIRVKRTLSMQEQAWLQEDQRWLAGLRDREGSIIAIDPFTADADSLHLLRTWVADQTAKEDSVPGGRLVAGRLAERWHSRGYLAARVLGRQALLLIPGKRFRLAERVIGGEEFTGRARLLATYLPSVGSVYDPVKLAEGIEDILVAAGELGYPFARWVTQGLEMDATEQTVVLRAMLLPGRSAVIGPVSGSLDRPRAKRFLARVTGLKRGAPFRHSALQRARERLLSRDLYSLVDEPRLHLTTSRDTIGVFFPVREKRKVNRFQVLLGLSRNENAESSHLSGEVDLNLPNLAGTGRALGLGWRDDGAQKSWFSLSYMEPLAFGTPLDTEFNLDSETLDDSYTRLTLDNRWRIPVVAMWGVEFGVGWDRTTYPSGSLAHTGRYRGRGAVLHYRGDPRRSGWSGSFALETAYRSSTVRMQEGGEEVTAKVGQDVRQQVLSGDLGVEWLVSSTFSIFGRAGYRQITGNIEEIPISEQFRFGGAATLRGYREDEFFGTRAAWGAIEARIGRMGGSRLYTFYDLGYFEFSTLDPQPDEPDFRSLKKGWPRGYGLGLLARTSGGDISLAVGFPGTVDFEQAKLHVTLMESF